MRDRVLRSRRRGLNPTKVVFVYCLSFVLVAFHQAGRVADWFDDLALNQSGLASDLCFSVSAFIRESIEPQGPMQMNHYEDILLAWTPTLEIGGWGVDTEPAPVQNPPISTAGTNPNLYPSDPLVEAGHQNSLAIKTPTIAAGQESYDLARLPDNRQMQQPSGPFNPSRILLLGDSMMLEGFGPQLQRELKKNAGLSVNRDGRYGTGLARLDAFDWLTYFDGMMDKYTPDLIIITLGANDTQDIVDTGKKRLFVATEAWNEVYAQRVANLLNRAAARGVEIFWVGLPVMGQEPYNKRVVNINRITAEICEKAANCRFWDSWLSVADSQGHYSTFLPDSQGKSIRIRAKDSIHLTEDGGRIMAKKFLAETSGWADYVQKPQPAPRPAPDENQASQNAPVPEYTYEPETEPADQPETQEDFEREIMTIDEPEPAPSAGESEEADSSELLRVLPVEHFSSARNKNVTYFLAKPETSLERPGPFPVVLLLHGAWDGPEIWLEQLGPKGLKSLADQHGLILVMPDGEPFGWYLDGRETAIETYIMAELLPHVLKNQPLADSGKLGICGLSMGGHGALTLALKHPGTFKAVSSLSGLTDLASHAGGGHPVDSQLAIHKVLGPAGENGELWRPHSAAALAEKHFESFKGTPLLIGVGRDDRLTVEENRNYHRLLNQLGLKHVYQETAGAHDWNYWSGRIPVHLEFMAEHLQ